MGKGKRNRTKRANNPQSNKEQITRSNRVEFMLGTLHCTNEIAEELADMPMPCHEVVGDTISVVGRKFVEAYEKAYPTDRVIEFGFRVDALLFTPTPLGLVGVHDKTQNKDGWRMLMMIPEEDRRGMSDAQVEKLLSDAAKDMGWSENISRLC